MAALNRSTKPRLVTRMLGTVRNDLNRAMTARTKPLPRKQAQDRVAVNTPIPTLAKSGLA